MARINIITEEQTGEHPWILRRAALEAQKALPDISINGEKGDINYFVNYALLKDPVKGISVGHYTHLEEKGVARQRFIQNIQFFDYFTTTCFNTSAILVKYGVLPEKIFKIPYGSDDRLKKDIVFGVVGRVYPSGRKGEYLVEKAVKEGYNFKAWGKGWPCKSDTTWANLPSFYSEIDYLVVTSLNEGGPIPVIDAIRAGVPVIAPDVGWCWEFPVIKYKKGDWNSLNQVLKQLTNAPTWEDWTNKHKNLFNYIIKNHYGR